MRINEQPSKKLSASDRIWCVAYVYLLSSIGAILLTGSVWGLAVAERPADYIAVAVMLLGGSKLLSIARNEYVQLYK